MARRKPTSPLEIKTFPSLVKALKEATGRGTALLSFAWLDDALDAFIRSRCVDDAKTVGFLFQGRGPIESFLARVHTAYAFGLIDGDTHKELLTLREIRNEFAHIRDPLTFTDESIAARCRKLQVPAVVEREVNDTIASDQDRFQLTCILLAAVFLQGAKTPRRPTDTAPITIRSYKGTGLAFEWIAKLLAIVRSIRKDAEKTKTQP